LVALAFTLLGPFSLWLHTPFFATSQQPPPRPPGPLVLFPQLCRTARADAPSFSPCCWLLHLVVFVGFILLMFISLCNIHFRALLLTPTLISKLDSVHHGGQFRGLGFFRSMFWLLFPKLFFCGWSPVFFFTLPFHSLTSPS